MQINQIWQGKYQILEFLGHGSLGTVYRAHDRFANRDVTIKSIDRANFSPGGTNEVIEEINAISQVLGHPNLVNLHAVEPGTRDVIAYIVSEYASGGDLRQFWKSLESEGHDYPQVAIDIAINLCQALQVIHGLDIYHLNIKPSNVLIDSDRRAKLADFGTAAILSHASSSSPGADHTSNYYAPEQYNGGSDERVDLYSVGLLLYEILVGRLPFHGTEQEIKIQKQTIDIEIPGSVSDSLKPVIQEALQREAPDRFQQAAEMEKSLRQAKIELFRGAISRPELSRDEVQKIRSHWRLSQADENILIKHQNDRLIRLLMMERQNCKGTGDEAGDEEKFSDLQMNAAGAEIGALPPLNEGEILALSSGSAGESLVQADLALSENAKRIIATLPLEEILQPELKELNTLIVSHKQGAAWFTEKLESTEAKLNAFRQSNQQLAQTVEKLEGELAETSELLRDTRRRLGESEKENDTLDEVRASLEKQIQETELQLQKQKKVNAKLADQLEHERNIVGEQKSELDQLEKTVEAQKGEITAQIQNSQKLQNELDTLQARLNQVSTELEAEREASEQLKQTLTETELQVTQEKEAHQKLTQNYQEAIKDCEGMAQTLEQVKGDLEARTAESAKLGAELESIQQRLSKALQEKEGLSQANEQLQQECDKQGAELEKLSESLASTESKLTSELESTQAELINHDVLLSETQKALDESKTSLAEVTETRDQLLQEKEALLEELNKIQGEVELSKQRKGTDALQQALEASETEKRQIAENLHSLEEELNKVTDDFAKRNQELKDTEAKLLAERQAHGVVTQQYKELGDRLNEINGIIAAQSENMEMILREKSDLAQKFAGLESQLESEEKSKVLIHRYWNTLSVELEQTLPDTMKLATALEGLKQHLSNS